MNFFEAIILGLVQGLTEFLPISSSAHVQLAHSLFGIEHPKEQLTAFIATIQLGTEAAVLIFFWKDITRILSAWFKTGFSKSPAPDAKLGWMVIIGSIPVVLVGLIFKKQIETDLRNLWIVGVTLIVFGLILGLADWRSKRVKEISQLSVRDGVLFGLGQMMAVIPGVSRSGGTITVGLALGYTRQAAARYSFLLAIPAVIASGLFEFATTVSSLDTDNLLAIALATAVSFISGILVIKFLLAYLNKGSFAPFVIWRVLVGALILVLLANGLIAA